MIYQFIAHTTPGKSRIYAHVRELDAAVGDASLEAVTTLGGNDVHSADRLVRGLNDFLCDRDGKRLESVLDQLPDAVRLAVRDFVARRCPYELGAFTNNGPAQVVRWQEFDDPRDLDDLEEFLEGAYAIGLGVRMRNVMCGGATRWEVELRQDDVVVPVGAEPRSWPLPPDAVLVETLVNPTGAQGLAGSAIKAAREADAAGRLVRVHTIVHGSFAEFVVDVFDAPPPVMSQAGAK